MSQLWTARAVLEPGAPFPDDAEQWIERWDRVGWLNPYQTIREKYRVRFCVSVGSQFYMASRPGAVTLFTNASQLDVFRKALDVGDAILTGSMSAQRYTDGAPPWGVQIYVADIDAINNAIDVEPNGRTEVVLIPILDPAMIGVEDAGAPAATFYQTVLDCYGGWRLMQEQADFMIGVR